MKKLILALSLVFVLSHCNNRDEDKTEVKKEKEGIKAGDREGADLNNLIDLEDAISAKQKISQRWDNKEDDKEVSNAGGDLEMPFRGYYLFSDGSMVKNPKDDLTMGTWTFDEKQRLLQFKLANGSTENYTVKSLDFKSLVLKNNAENGKEVEYIADGFLHKDLKDEPFYPVNLQWRIKPKAPENDAALHKRIKNYLHFFYLYHFDNIERNEAFMPFYRLPSSLKFSGGAIYLTKEKELDKNWTNIFYNDADASKAYTILDKMISKKYVWNEKERDWRKQNAGVLKQMEAAIDSL